MTNFFRNLLPLLISSLFSTIINGQSDELFLNDTFESLQPTAPTLAPTYRPSRVPTESPTNFPTVAVASYIQVNAQVGIRKLSKEEVESNQETYEILFGDAAGLDTNEVTIRIDSLIVTDDSTGEFYEACNSTGVQINYEIISDDTNDYSQIRLSILNGEFLEDYSAGLLGITSDESVTVCTEVEPDIVTGYDLLTKKEAFPPSPEATVAELLWSEYLFLGFLTSLLGVVWLWYLRSDVDDDNIYETNDDPQKAGAVRAATNSAIDREQLDNNNTAVEMTNQ